MTRFLLPEAPACRQAWPPLMLALLLGFLSAGIVQQAGKTCRSQGDLYSATDDGRYVATENGGFTGPLRKSRQCRL